MQQINLYLPEFRPNREPLRAIHMIVVSAAFLLLLISFTLYSNLQNARLQTQLLAEQKVLQDMQTQLQLINSKKPSQPSAEIDLKLSQAQNKLQREQQILALISHQDLGNDKGFSAQMNALGQAALSTISVETFSLQKGGRYAELSGLARSADQVPLYLQQLRKDSSFASVGFGVLNIERDENQPGLLQFSVAKAKPIDENDKKSKGANR